MRVLAITDIHANLPALEVFLDTAKTEGYDAIFHMGDAVAIGPHPVECLELLLNTPDIYFVRGNHDTLLAEGLPQTRPASIDEGEWEHQLWTHAQVSESDRNTVAQWQYLLVRMYAGVRVAFMHYPLGAEMRFAPFVQEPSAANYDALFARYDADLIFFGHQHTAIDVQGRARYINPGSLGCQRTAIAPFIVAVFEKDGVVIEHRSLPYDDTRLFADFERRQVPARDSIYKIFFGGRFSAN